MDYPLKAPLIRRSAWEKAGALSLAFEQR